MKKIMMGFVVVSFLLLGLAGQAMAIGLGGYLEAGGGDGEFEYEYFSDFDVDVDAGAFGFVLDTDLTDNGVFNYRLNVGLERLDLEDDFGDTLELGGLVVANTFGFAIVRNPDFRWWIGPQIRVGLYGGELESDPSADYGLVSFAVGGVTGINFLTGKFCVSTSLGILSTGFAGETDELGLDREFDGNATTAFLNIAFMFAK